MAHSNANINFPSQVVSDMEKLSYDYGLKVAKAIETNGSIMIDKATDTKHIKIIFTI